MNDLLNKNRKRQTSAVKPAYIVALAERIGAVKAAQKIGVHATTYNNYLRTEQAPYTSELAARSVFQDMFGSMGTPVVVAARITKENAPMLEAFLKGINAEDVTFL